MKKLKTIKKRRNRTYVKLIELSYSIRIRLINRFLTTYYSKYENKMFPFTIIKMVWIRQKAMILPFFIVIWYN